MNGASGSLAQSSSTHLRCLFRCLTISSHQPIIIGRQVQINSEPTRSNTARHKRRNHTSVQRAQGVLEDAARSRRPAFHLSHSGNFALQPTLASGCYYLLLLNGDCDMKLFHYMPLLCRHFRSGHLALCITFSNLAPSDSVPDEPAMYNVLAESNPFLFSSYLYLAHPLTSNLPPHPSPRLFLLQTTHTQKCSRFSSLHSRPSTVSDQVCRTTPCSQSTSRYTSILRAFARRRPTGRACRCEYVLEYQVSELVKLTPPFTDDRP